MSRMEGSPSLETRWLRRNLSLDVLASVGIGVTIAMVVSLLPSIAREAGMAPIVLALLAAGEPIQSYLHQGCWLDLGRPEDYERAHLAGPGLVD